MCIKSTYIKCSGKLIRFSHSLFDYIRLMRIVWLEKHLGNLKVNKQSYQYEHTSDISPIVSSYLAKLKKYKIKIEYKINGHFFTRIESILIKLFTGNGSYYVNHALASPKPYLNSHKKILIKVLGNVLMKIERTDNVFVYRMDSYANNYLDKTLLFFKTNMNKTISIPWFLSTTEKSKPWSNIVWKIKIGDKSRTKARDFYKYNNNHGEEYEVRFERNVNFKIVNIESINSKELEDFYVINMEERYDDKFDIRMDYTKYFI